MTPDEWEDFFKEWVKRNVMALPWEPVFISLSQPVEVTLSQIEAQTIEHPAVVGYFDHLYAQELGIRFP